MGIKAIYNSQPAEILIKNTVLFIYCSTDIQFPLSSVKSLHVKNEDPMYHLKIKLTTSDILLSFTSINTRDIVKSLLVYHIKPEQDTIKAAINQDKNIKRMYDNTKNVLDTNTFISINKNQIKDIQAVLQESSATEISTDAEKFVYSLSPQLLEIFGELGCSINQFFNYVTSSNFASLSNKPNTFDRLLSEKLRDYKTGNDAFSRINTHSVLSLSAIDECVMDARAVEDKAIDFEPVYYLHKVDKKLIPRDFVPSNTKLKCEIDVFPEERASSAVFDEKDLIRLRDLRRVVYLSKGTDEYQGIVRNVSKFVDEIKKKYGANVSWLARLLPDYE